MSGLKILWIAHFVPHPPTSGAVQRTYQLLRHAARRHDITILALNRRALLPDSAALAEASEAIRGLGTQLEVFQPPADASRARWAVMAAASALGRRPYSVNWLRSRRFAAAVKEKIRSGHFDLVHVDTIALMPALPALRGPPIVLNHHNIESQMLDRRADRETRRWKRWYLRREAAKLATLERACGASVALNLVVSALDGERLDAVATGARWSVVENGVDPDWFAPAENSRRNDPHQLVFSGTMGWYPNDDAMRFFLREVWPELCERDPEFRLTIVGRRPSKELQEFAAMDTRVTVTGEVHDTRPFLQHAAIYVCPIRDGGGTRLKVLEALAMGLPLVATPLAMEGLAVTPDQHFVSASTPKQLLDGILRLRDRPELRRRLGGEGRALVQAFYTWDVIGGHLEDAYQAARRVQP